MRNVKSSSASTAKPGILLLEEYGALAAAIASALKKFAPNHATHVARSLKEAESLVATITPELLIIDVDPPWPKLTQLLGKLRGEHPEARVLIIGGTIPKPLIEHGGSRRALQFLEKPFDVPELGAAVQALLGPWKDAQSEDLRGTLRTLGVIDAALLQCASARTVVIEIKKGSTKTGELHFVDGHLVHVENGKRSGVAALEEMFGWSHPEIREKEKRGGTVAKRTIPAPWTDAFLEALENTREEQPAKALAKSAPTLEPEPLAPPPTAIAVEKTGKKIVVVDDTEMLLIFVEDVLATADPQLRITTAGNGLDGVEEVARVLPDLVLLDYSLPDFNGDEVCRRLLQDERTAGIPVLMMSGHVPEMTRVAATSENVVAKIGKPFRSEALVAMVRETLEQAPELRKRKAEAAQKSLSVRQDWPSAEPVIPTKSPRSQRTESTRAKAPETATPPAPALPPAKSKSKSDAAPVPPAPVPPPPPPVVIPPKPVAAPAPPPAAPPAPPTPMFAPPRAPQPPATPFEQPMPHVRSVAPPVQQIPRPGITANVPHSRAEPAAPLRSGTIAAPVLTSGMNDVVLGLFLEVVSLQLTPALRMGMMRAKPSSLTVSLHVASPALRASLPANGFQMGAIDLDRSGRIAAIRLIPTPQPFMPMQTRNSLQIAGVAVVPENSHKLLQLTPQAGAPMRMHLLAPMEMAGVELSSTFQISHLVLKSRGHNVRVTLSEEAIESKQSGTICETSGVQLDAAAHLTELTLNPVS